MTEITREDREAFFGGFRVICDGQNLRGFFSREKAEEYIKQQRAKRLCGPDTHVEDRSLKPDHPLYGWWINQCS